MRELITNSTTQTMQSYAAARGLKIKIVKITRHHAGFFYACHINGKDLRRLKCLGKTRTEAELKIDEMASRPMPTNDD